MDIRHYTLVVIALWSGMPMLMGQKNSLSILEDGVNIRKEPSTDATVEVQVNSGKNCNVLNQSKFFETVGRHTDYWYEVSTDGKRGWVFGAQTSLRLSANPQLHEMVFKRAERDATLHLWFEGTRLEDQGWKGHGTRVWDFGYADEQNEYKGLKFYKGGNKEGDISVSGMQDKLYVVQWKVAPQQDSRTGISTDKEVPVIIAIKKLKEVKLGKEPKPVPDKAEKDPKKPKVEVNKSF